MLLPYLEAGRLEAGCDEAGRGCLAGPVVAAAVILPEKNELLALNDSKKLNEKQRLELRPLIETQAIAWAVAFVWPAEIDAINILQASFKAMHLAVKKLKPKPEHLLIDGNRFKPYKTISHTCIVKGDGKMASIAAASILAKTARDDYMEKLALEFPNYAWEQNKGYPTKRHRKAIAQYGMTIHHRQSFTCLPEQLSLDL